MNNIYYTNNDLETNPSESNIIKNIKHIEKQLSYIKSIYDKATENNVSEVEKTNNYQENGPVHNTKMNQSVENIQKSIEEVVSTIEPSNKKIHTKEVEKEKNDKNIYSSKQKEIEENEINISYDFVQHVQDNTTLIISEKEGKVFLPYHVNELKAYLDEYPEEYNSLTDVVNQEYIIPISKYKNPRSSRFRETYALMRDIEMKSIIESFKKSFGVMLNSNLNPAIIAACKSEHQLNNYIYCLEHNKLNEFKDFKIIFEMVPFNNQNNQLYDWEYREPTRKKRGKHY